jgi:NAD(P)-dependent dehydrogenase (short-subunit alcohol dehydrogenase family)
MARSVLITGGTSGIGESMVRLFASAGYVVWFTYRSGRERAERLKQELENASIQFFHFEQGQWESHQTLLAALPGPVDILINNAGLGTATVTHFVEGAHLQDQALLQVNAVGVLWLSQAVIPAMLERGFGKIITISSVDGGITQFPGFRLADGMSKAALAFMTRQLAAEQAHSPIDVFAICPGATETPMFEASTLNSLNVAERDAFVANLPKCRLIQPEEIAQLALYLCQDEGRVLHGAVLDASLGLGVSPGLVTSTRKR